MYQNCGCYTPPNHKKDNCSCKDGMLCALDWFYQDFLLKGNSCLTSIKYYPELPNFYDCTQGNTITNTIYNIPYITQDIVPVYTSIPATEPYTGDITYLNICKLDGFEFKIRNNCDIYKIENDICLRFSKISYSSINCNCCKNGTMEFLLKAKDFLLNLPTDTAQYVTLSTSTKSYRATQILAINNDTIWFKNTCTSETDSSETTAPVTTYYVLSLCELIGITFNRVPNS